MEKRQRGFTLVELMVASLLAGIVLVIALPLILVGRNTDVRTEKKEAIAMAGEAIYEYIADEMKFAGQLYIGDLQDKKPVGENWKSITASEKDPEAGESYARLLFGSARELIAGENADPGSPLYDETYQEKTDLVIEAEAVGQNQLCLTVKLMEGEQELYEKTSVLSLLNLTLNATSQIEGYVGGPMTTAVDTETANGTSEEGEGLNQPALNSLVLWYKSSRETVSPFIEGDLGEDETDGLIPDFGAAVVSLANPQYVKAGQSSEIQYKVQAGSGQSIIKYEWSIADNTNNTEDGSFYIKDPQWDQRTMKYTVEGLNATPDNHAVTLGLTVFFRNDSDGSETSLTDRCSVIVYEGYKPGEGPVDHFVIVPGNALGEPDSRYLDAQWKNASVWIKEKSEKTLFLVAVDQGGNLTQYSTDGWGRPYPPYEKKYLGFHNDSHYSSNMLADGVHQLADGKRIDVLTGWNKVDIKATGSVSNNNLWDNSMVIYFGGDNGTAYHPASKKAVSVMRKINLYNAENGWRYGIDSGKREKVAKPEEPIKVSTTSGWIDLEITLDVKYESGTKEMFVPELDEDTVQWTLENGSPFNGGAVQRFEINDKSELYPQLHTGMNVIQVSFKDTVGESYTDEIRVNVPTEVDSVKFDQPENITLLKLENIFKPGITTQDISFSLYDESGQELGRELIDEYMIDWEIDSVDNAFTIDVVEGALEVPTIRAKNTGTGSLKLILKEKVASEGDLPKQFECKCNVTVVPLELKSVLLYQNDGSEILRKTFNTGMTIVLTDSTQDRLKGFSAEISLPEEFKSAGKELEGTDWDKADWSTSGDTKLFTVGSGTQANDYQGSFSKNKSGEIIFKVTARKDPDIFMTIPVTIGAGIVNNIKVWDSNGKNKGTLVIGAGAKKEEYNSVTLHAEMHATSNNPFNKDVKWEIIKGKDLIDLKASSILPGIPVDSTDVSKYPKIVLKKNLTDEDAGDNKIEIKVSSVAAPAKYDVYKISILPQFRIISPSYDLELEHYYSSNLDVSGHKKLQANKNANWSLPSDCTDLKFQDSIQINTQEVSIETVKYSGNEKTYTITAQDTILGQIDSRKVTVVFTSVDEGDSDSWVMHLDPSGKIYLAPGETLLVKVYSTSLFITMRQALYLQNMDRAGKSVDSVKTSIKDKGSNRKFEADIVAVKPGRTRVTAHTYLLGWESKSNIEVIVCGFQLPEKKRVEMKKNNIGTGNIVKMAELDGFGSWDMDMGNCEWTSSNESIAEVDAEGNVVMKAPGKTVITVSGMSMHTGTDCSASCELTVTVPDSQEIQSVKNCWSDSLNYSDMERILLIDSRYGSADMHPEILPKNNGIYAAFYTVDSDPADKKVINISGDHVTAGYPGTAKIMTEAADKKAEQILTVKVYELKEITIDVREGKDMLTLLTGTDADRSVTLGVVPVIEGPEGVIPVKFKKCSWRAADSNSESIVKVTDNGDGTCTVKAIGMGVAYITCTSDANPNISETYVVIVSF